MFRTIAIAFVLAGALAASVAHAQPANPNPDVATAVEGNNQFAFDLYARLAQKPGNKFFSPYSISNALAMTYAGAKGQTATEMAKTLHFTLQGDKLHPALGDVIRQLQGKDKDRPFKLNTVNRLWAQNGLKIRPEFLAITQSDYQSGLQQVNFAGDPDGSRKTINHWVEEQTNDKIKELLKPGIIKPLTRLVLTNAIYFKADWLSPFTEKATRPEIFTIPGTPAFKVPMMHQTLNHLAYLATDDFQLVQLPYKGEEVSMVVILPKKTDGLAEVEKKLSAKVLKQNVANAKRARVAVMMPKFKMTEEFQLNDELVALGMPTAFSDAADFSGLADTSVEKLKITAVVHKAFVEVDEKGTEAAAATAVVIGRKLALPPEDPPIPFRADHPFLFVIQHNATGSILFLGRVYDPR